MIQESLPVFSYMYIHVYCCKHWCIFLYLNFKRFSYKGGICLHSKSMSNPFFTAIFFSVLKLTKTSVVLFLFHFYSIFFTEQFGSHHMTAQSVISYNNKYTVKVIPSFEQSLRQNKTFNIYYPATNFFCSSNI